MRKLFGVSIGLLFVGLLCLAQQPSNAFWQTRGSNYNQSVSTGATATITLLSGNDWTNAAWNKVNVAAAPAVAADPAGGNTATPISTVSTTFAGVNQVTIPNPLVGGTTYTVTGYVQNVTPPKWMRILVFDPTSGDAFGRYFDTAACANGTTTESGGTGVFDSSTIVSAGSPAFCKFTLTGHFTATTNANPVVYAIFADTDGTSTATSGQAYNVWAWGCSPCSP